MVEAYPATGDFDRAATLKVLFEHPSDSSLDVTVLLAPTPTGWRAEAAVPAGHHWNLSAADAAGTWRLKGRMDKGGHAARLAPALRTSPEMAPGRGRDPARRPRRNWAPARATDACFHCGDALPAEPVLAVVGGTRHPFCCSGCAAASA